MRRIIYMLISSVCILLLQACGAGNSKSADAIVAPPIATAARIEVPPNPNEEWVLVAPDEVGMDGSLLARALTDLPAAATHGLASMLVLRQGKPVFEQYWNGYHKDMLHDLRSATKSITALLVGAAIDQHFLSGVDEPLSARLAKLYPDAPGLKQGITLEHVLTMSTGLSCDDRNPDSPGNEDKMYKSADWVRYLLYLSQAAAPGTATHYCTGGAVALGRVIAEASRSSIPEFSKKFLLAPLGISNVQWADFDHQQQTDTGGHLQMRPRDLAKLGQLMIQKGSWKGNQLLSAAWVNTVSSQHVLIDNGWKYGYLWWLRLEPYKGKKLMMHFAWGNGGQYLFIIPELELVVVFTGENYNSDKAERPFTILEQYILPSIL
ncbi:serine hydrolase domain-containing protein [Undibacterium sp. Ren11W]|uniref:serine hydrolase domain-containing protein n=1 Tax=Undibacterium sp. Ren11W TaxID=3413045 RepID=UPI003BF3E287